MPVQVEEVTPTKSGKALRVKLSGKWYGAFKDSGLDQQVGKLIEAEIEVNDKFGPQIKKWVPVAAPQGAVAIPPAAVAPPPATPAAAAPDYDERNPPAEGYARPAAQQHLNSAFIFMSGAVNNAIQAGKVGSPVEVRAWASASLAAFYDALDDLRKLRE